MLRHLALLPLGAVLLGAGPSPEAEPCSMFDATYTARPAIASATRIHRLKTEPMPQSINTLFRFQTFDSRTGKRLSELRMHYGCGNGHAPCSVSPPSRPGPDGGLYSEVVHLNRDFSPSSGAAVPYALILPSFDRADWLFTTEEMTSPDLTLAPGAIDGPDLSDAIVWTLTSCGGRAVG